MHKLPSAASCITASIIKHVYIVELTGVPVHTPKHSFGRDEVMLQAEARRFLSALGRRAHQFGNAFSVHQLFDLSDHLQLKVPDMRDFIDQLNEAGMRSTAIIQSLPASRASIGHVLLLCKWMHWVCAPSLFLLCFQRHSEHGFISCHACCCVACCDNRC